MHYLSMNFFLKSITLFNTFLLVPLRRKLQLRLMCSQVFSQTQDGSELLKQRNCEEFKARSQLSALKEVEVHVKASGWDQEERQALATYSNLHQTNLQVGQFTFWSTFSAKISHGQLQTHKTDHGPNSGEATTFPHIVFFMPPCDTHIQMVFCPMTPKEESRNYHGLDSRNFAGL